MNAFTLTPNTQTTTASMADLAHAPQRVRTDEGTVEERPIDQAIQGDVYTRLDVPKTVIGPGNLWGMGVARTRPSDSLGTQRRWPGGSRIQ